MTDWSNALSHAFQRHVVSDEEAPPVNAPIDRLDLGIAEGLGTTGTTGLRKMVPGSVAVERAELNDFAVAGTKGTTGTNAGLHGGEDDENSFAERAALVEEGAGVPRAWAVAFARLDLMIQRHDVDRRQLMDDAGRFLDRWGVEASELGWSATDVFGIEVDRPLPRLRSRGLALLIRGGTVESIRPDRATIRMPDGGTLVYLRRPRPGLPSGWERVERFDPVQGW